LRNWFRHDLRSDEWFVDALTGDQSHDDIA